jgi:hypothetical protein
MRLRAVLRMPLAWDILRLWKSLKGEVDYLQFANEVCLAQVSLTLFDADPDGAGHNLRGRYDLRPELTTVWIPLIRRRATERETQTDNETEHGKQKRVDLDYAKYQFSVLGIASPVSVHIRGYTIFEINVMHVAHPEIKIKGKIIFGSTLPCIRMKNGHLECLSMLRGPEK